jgi:hypothetical protein
VAAAAAAAEAARLRPPPTVRRPLPEKVRGTKRQGLTLVHYSAQPEPFLSLNLDNYSPRKRLR